MRFRKILLTATVLAVPVAASAQPITGLYVGAGGGYSFFQNDKVFGLSTPATRTEGFLQSNGAAVGLGSVGWGFGNGLRVEVEGDYRGEFSLEKLRGALPGPGGLPASGNEQDYSAMANVLYDIDLRPEGISFVSPYVGIGAGYTWTDFNPMNLNSVPGAAQRYRFNGTQTSGGFSYNAIVGASFPIPAVPGLALTAEYRLLGMPFDRDFTGSATFAPGAIAPRSPAETTPASFKIQNSYNHSFLLGLRYAFYTPPPPPPPAPVPVAAPAPAAARTYLVFFDWDRADLTVRARQIIKEAADASTHVQYTRIVSNGYTDLSGTAAYNQRLSVRRAQSVANELVADGVPRAAITIHGFGESNPMVPTAQGVREAQNRRVEIIIQ